MAPDIREVPNSGSATLPTTLGSGSIVQLLNPATLTQFAPRNIIFGYPNGTVPVRVSVIDAAGTITDPSNDDLTGATRVTEILGSGGGTALTNQRVHISGLSMREFEQDVLLSTDGAQDAMMTAYIDGIELQR